MIIIRTGRIFRSLRHAFPDARRGNEGVSTSRLLCYVRVQTLGTIRPRILVYILCVHVV